MFFLLSYLKYSSVHLEKAGIFFAAPLKSTGSPGSAYCSKKSWDDGTKSVLSIGSSGGWWDPNGSKWPGGCLDSRGEKIQTKFKINIALMVLSKQRTTSYGSHERGCHDYIPSVLRVSLGYFCQRVEPMNYRLLCALTSRSKHGRSSIATQNVTFYFIIFTIALTITFRTQNDWLHFLIFYGFQVLLKLGFCWSLRANLELDWLKMRIL